MARQGFSRLLIVLQETATVGLGDWDPYLELQSQSMKQNTI